MIPALSAPCSRWFSGLLAMVILSFLVVTTTAQAQEVHADQRINVVVTTGMVGDLVRSVGGDRVKVVDLIPPGVDPHLYKATRSDLRKLLNADIIFYSGLMLEGRMGDTLVRLARDGKPVYPVTELVDEATLLEPEDFEGQYDPHLWMDISAWMNTVDVVSNALCKIDSSYCDTYKANADVYCELLKKLDEYAISSIASIPESSRFLITAHDAFNYFGRRYDIQVVGIQGISTTTEAGLHDINSMIDVVVANKIPAIFVESSVSDKNVKALVEGAQSRGHEVKIGGEIYSDAMGPQGTYEGTYIGMMDHNVTKISRALGGEAPESGMQGKLQSDNDKAEERPSS